MNTGSGHEPPPDVLAAFGVAGRPTPLEGGQGRSWRVGTAVLKPSDLDERAEAWQAEVLGTLDGHRAFRVSPPLPTRDGRWLEQGWCAARWQPGRHETGRWADIVAVGREFHAALTGVPQPAWLLDRTDRWAVADRVAWGELPADRHADVPHLAALVAAVRPVRAAGQVIHGDLTGNVLFADDRPPLVIDLSPYWRPAPYAAAIVAVDALVFEGAGPEVVDVLDGPDTGQYLLRALIFRIVADHLAQQHETLNKYAPAVRLALRHARA